MMMMMVLRGVIVLVVPRAELEDMAQCREYEQQEFKEHLLCRRHSHYQRQNEHEL